MEKITEQSSRYDHLETMSTEEMLECINREDQQVALAVQQALPQIAALVDGIVARMKQGGRVFYIGAGTSGRLGVLDASELPPTFGASPEEVIGIIAGGEQALRNPVEHAEDDAEQGWKDVLAHHPEEMDCVVGIAASGTTPYVIGAVEKAREAGLLTGCITSNPGAPLAEAVECPIVTVVGPEFVTGSSRMKSGTAQKMVLNMISTATMIQLGHVVGNRMVDMQLTNHKLVERGVAMIVAQSQLSPDEARKLLLEKGSVRAVLETK